MPIDLEQPHVSRPQTMHERSPSPLLRLAAAIAVTLLALAASHAAEGPRRPNIVLIIADDLGWGDLGSYGQRHIRTPRLDRMAAEGMRFTQAYSASPVCMPARGCLLTGRDTGHASVRGNPGWTATRKSPEIGDAERTVAEDLGGAGYRTAVIGKWGMAEAGESGMPQRHGFDDFLGFSRHGPAHHYYPEWVWKGGERLALTGNDTRAKRGVYVHDLFTDGALEFVRGNAGRPFFLLLAYTIPHYELTVPADSKAPYVDKGWPDRPMKTGHYYHDDDPNVAYAGMVSRLDRDVGRLLDLLGELGIDDRTLVLFTSDNGPEYDKGEFFDSNGPLRGGKRDLYEGGIRVPLIARWPGKVPGGVVSDHVCAFWDFRRTFADVAGTAADGPGEGISFAPTLLADGRRQERHQSLYWEFNEGKGPFQAIRAGDWKGVRRVGKPLQLFDLAKDPGERDNVAAQNPEVVARLEALLAQARTDDPEYPLKHLRR